MRKSMIATISIINENPMRVKALKNVKKTNRNHAGMLKKIFRYFFCIFVTVSAHLGSNPKNFV